MAYMYLGDGAEPEVEEDRPPRFGTILNWVGAIMSVTLIGGLTAWGYELAMRDVTGVPVVRALEGPMRVAPADPGGQRAAHQGLAVNSVAAEGTAEPPPERLVLAPPPLALTDEDMPRAQLDSIKAPEPLRPGTLAEAMIAATGGEQDGFEDEADEADEEIAAASSGDPEADPATDPATDPDPDAETETAAAAVPRSRGGVAISPRPRPRPAEDLTARAVAADVVLAALQTPAVVDVDPETLDAGTRLVQFGAYDSPAAARAEWDRLDGRFTDFLADKRRVIQRAESGGKTFFRLRALGFSDINDARRFCSAFLAERQPCIPVVLR